MGRDLPDVTETHLTSLDGDYKTILDKIHLYYLILMVGRLENVTASVTGRIAVKSMHMGSRQVA
jgi:hypothetical protein